MKPGPKPKVYRDPHRCPVCRRARPLAEFRVRYWVGARAVLWNPRCRECLRQWDREQARTERVRARHRVSQLARYHRDRVRGREQLRESYRRVRDRLSDGYVRHLLGWQAPAWVIALKRAQLTLRRALKTNHENLQ